MGISRAPATGPGAIDVLVSQSVVRAAPGGMGNVKAGGNYAVTLKITEDAKAIGCSQVLFLDARDRRYVEEMGGMNIMFVQNGRLRTPPLTDTILRGVTRDSLLVLAADLGVEVSEAPIAIDEVVDGLKDGSISEMFACGTAAVVIGINSLRFEDGSSIRTAIGGPGPLTTQLYETLVGVQYGRLPDRHGWIREVCPADCRGAGPAGGGKSLAVPVHRFFAPSLDPGDETVVLPRDEAEHLTRVLRLTPGDTVAVFDGRGHEFLARVAAASPPRRAPAAPLAPRAARRTAGGADPGAGGPQRREDGRHRPRRGHARRGGDSSDRDQAHRDDGRGPDQRGADGSLAAGRARLGQTVAPRHRCPRSGSPLQLEDFLDEPPAAVRLMLVEPGTAAAGRSDRVAAGERDAAGCRRARGT